MSRSAGAGCARCARRCPASELMRLSRIYWMIVGVAAIFTLARFSEAFLLLRAQSVGLPVAIVPMVLVVMNIVYTLTAWPAGALSDRIGRYGVVTVGFALLVLADLALAIGGTITVVMVGVVLWGLHMGLTQGLLSALVARLRPRRIARHRLRHVQSGERHRNAGQQVWSPAHSGTLPARPARFSPARHSPRLHWRCFPSCDGGRQNQDTANRLSRIYTTTVSFLAARVMPV